MKNKKGFTLVEVVISFVIITIIMLNAAVFFLFAWKLKVQFEDDRAVLGILTSFIEAKKAACLGTAIRGFVFSEEGNGEFGSWKTYCIEIWDYTDAEKKNLYPPLIYPLPSTNKFDDVTKKPEETGDNKYVKINYQWCKIEIDRDDTLKPKKFLMPSMYVWCRSPRSKKVIGMQVTNAFPWRNYNNGHNDRF